MDAEGLAGNRKGAYVDLLALQKLAETSMPLNELKATGFRSVCISSDLFPYGYSIRHWVRLTDRLEVVEYRPMAKDDRRIRQGRRGILPRITAHTYQRQAAVHAALGLNLVQPGEPWQDFGTVGLFDEIFLEEAAGHENLV